MDISINTEEGVPIYRQIVTQIRYMIASGLLKPNEDLPPIRTLATSLRVTPNTVVKAYDELCSSGLIAKRRGSGCFVTEIHSKFSEKEKHRILEQRIDALLAEGHQLGVPIDVLYTLLDKRVQALHKCAAKVSGEAS